MKINMLQTKMNVPQISSWHISSRVLRGQRIQRSSEEKEHHNGSKEEPAGLPPRFSQSSYCWMSRLCHLMASCWTNLRGWGLGVRLQGAGRTVADSDTQICSTIRKLLDRELIRPAGVRPKKGRP
jgi:hypothetical protein